MNDKSRLRDQIMNHWLTHRPQMVKELLRKNQLKESLRETEEGTADLLFELVSVQKMNYAEAWEIAIQEWAFLPTEDHLLQPSSTELGPEPARSPSRDFRINDSHQIGKGSLREKAAQNLAAIHTLKQVEAENRDATDEEKAPLARYSGWGALANAFRPYPPSEWEQVSRELRALLTDEEYSSARASTPNAHFTSPMVVTAMWDAMQRLGLQQGAQILEPSMGVGHFFGLMPASLMLDSRRTGVELDSLTARIGKTLYPEANILAKGFEETTLPDNYFDAAIGNIPFGN